MKPVIVVSPHALARWNERVVRSGKRPVTADEVRDIVRRHVRRRGGVMLRRGDGFLVFHRGLKIIVAPHELGWAVVTVWPLRRVGGGKTP